MYISQGVFLTSDVSLLWISSLKFKQRDVATVLRMEKILRLAQKYQVDSAKPFVLAQLKLDWPTSLAQWLRARPNFERIGNVFDEDEEYDHAVAIALSQGIDPPPRPGPATRGGRLDR